jgi:kynurenine 3-monooxygenase
MLARRGYKVKVYDKLKEPVSPDSFEWSDKLGERNYNIGLNGRGQKALTKLEMMKTIEKYTIDVVGRLDWSPSNKVDEPTEIIFRDRTYTTKCLQRDRLAGSILEEVKTKYSDSISCEYNMECTDVEWLRDDRNLGKEVCLLTLQSTVPNQKPAITRIERSQFVIGADGAQSLVRRIIEESSKSNPSAPIKLTQYEDKNVRVYRTIPLHLPDKDDPLTGAKKKRKDLNYSARTKFDINMDALPTKEGKYLGVLIYRPWDKTVTGLNSSAQAREFFDKKLPMFAPFIKDSDLDEFVAKNDSKFPRFTYVGPNLHKGETTVLIGDAIHTVKPFFGLGVNSAMEDVIALDSALERTKDNVKEALQLFSRERAPQAKAMVKISKGLDGGVLSFIIPLIIDNTFKKIAPKIFAGNTIALLQNQEVKFTSIRMRKRIDRVMQVATLFGVGIFAKALISKIRFVLSTMLWPIVLKFL